MSVSMVALSSGRMLTTAVDGSLAAKVLRLRNRQGAWDGSAKRAVRGRGLGRVRSPLPGIKIFLVLYNGSVIKSASYIVLYASQTIEYC